jgi:uncharacterized membrane protein YgcG
MNSQVLHVMDLRTTLANLKYLLLYLTSTPSAILPPPPLVRGSRRAEAIPVKRVLGGVQGEGGSGSAGSSYTGNGGGASFRMGIGRFFGGGGGSGSNSASLASSLQHSGQ